MLVLEVKRKVSPVGCTETGLGIMLPIVEVDMGVLSTVSA